MTLIALLVIAGQLSIQFMLSQYRDNGRFIDLAGEARTMSQGILEQAINLHHATTLLEQNAQFAELETSLLEWNELFYDLKTYDTSGILGGNSSDLPPLFREAENHYVAIEDNINCILIINGASGSEECSADEQTYIDAVIRTEIAFSNTMSRIGEIYEDQYQNSIDTFSNFTWIIVLLTIVVLITIRIFVLIPTIKRAETAFNSIIATRNNFSQSEARFRYMAENIDEAFWMTSADNTDIYFVNPAYEAITGMSPMELFSDPDSWQRYIHIDDRVRLIDTIKETAQTNGFQTDYRVIFPTGEQKWIWHRVRHIRDQRDQIIFRVMVAMDITERKRVEEELRHARDAAEIASRAKTTFLANMSHELRTPLNAILGFAQLMEAEVQEDVSSSEEHLKIIMSNGEHLLALINDVLDMSRIEAGKTTVEPENINFGALIKEIEEMFQPKAMSKGLLLMIEQSENLPKYIRVDARKLRQILINLIDNAIKFTDEGSVALRLHCRDNGKENLRLHFEVEDTGQGINENDLDQLFDPFSQTEKGYRKYQGTGLGLPISQRFVHMLGGDQISVKSIPDVGSIFKFVIPVIEINESSVNPTKPNRMIINMAPGQPKFRILIVDDNSESRLLVEKLLQPLGFGIQVAFDGEDAVKLAERWVPHLIFMDMKMPGMDGYEATRRIRAGDLGQQVVIIGLTASAFDVQEDPILEAGCNDILRKPFRQNEIFDMLNRHLNVQFIYGDVFTNGEVVDKSISHEHLKTMKSPWRRALQKAARNADSRQVNHIISEISTENVKVANALKDLADHYEFDRIVMLLDEDEQNSGPK